MSRKYRPYFVDPGLAEGLNLKKIGIQEAANDILGYVMKFMELKDLEDRLTNLEKQMNRNEKAHTCI